jgi:hypothetical protein
MNKQKMIGISDNAGIYRKKLHRLRKILKKENPEWLDDADRHELKKHSFTGLLKIIIDRFEKTLSNDTTN